MPRFGVAVESCMATTEPAFRRTRHNLAGDKAIQILNSAEGVVCLVHGMLELNVQVHRSIVGTERRDLIPSTIGGAVLKSVERCVRQLSLASVLVIRRWHDKIPYCGLEYSMYLTSTLQVELASRAMAVDGEKLDCFREKPNAQAMRQRTDSRDEALLFLKSYLSVLQIRWDYPFEDFEAVKHLESRSVERVAFAERLNPALGSKLHLRIRHAFA